MIIRSDSLRTIAIVVLVVLLCGGLASCGGGGSGPVTQEPATGGGGDEMTITPPPSQDAPDLVVGSPSASDSGPAAGASFTLSATVSNAGGGASPATTLRYYRSTDTAITTSDTAVGTATVVALGASASVSGSIDLTAPSSPGAYYYGACVDAVADESNAKDNCSAAVEVTVQAQVPGDEGSLTGAPDLVVGSPSVSDSGPTAGASFTLSATVSNAGDGESPGTTLRYYRSTDTAITSSDTAVGTATVAELGASGSASRSVNLTAPSSPGTYYYGACVDAVADESDAGNNCSSVVEVTVQQSLAPDLVVESASVSDSTPNPGEWVGFEATVRNRGNAPSAPTRFRYYIVYGDEETISYESEKIELTYPPVQGLEPSESVTVLAGAGVPVVPNTYYHYGGCLDPVEGESDTTNNCSKLFKVTIEPSEPGQPIHHPDLVVDSASVNDSTPYVGDTFTLGVTVRNQGANRSGNVNVQFFRSEDATIEWEDEEVAWSARSGLDSGDSGVLSKELTAPSSAGTYYYGACVEMPSPDPRLVELVTDNNCSPAARVDAQPVPPGVPDLVVQSPSLPGRTTDEYGRYTIKVKETITIEMTVRNQGTGPSAATTLRYYGDMFSTFPGGGSRRGTATVSGLSASGAERVSTQVRGQYGAGWYNYRACVDPPATEAVTGNNCSSVIEVKFVE